MPQQPRVLRPTFEHHPTGFGVGHSKPRISWRFLANENTYKNWIQSSYDIEITKPGSSEVTVHHAEGSQSILVPWPCDPLKSRERVSIRVRARGHHDVDDTESTISSENASATAWSDQVTVEAALLDQRDWTASPITSSLDSSKDGPLPPERFRKPFSIPDGKTVANARLYVTSFGVYEAYVNGHRAGTHSMAPGWTSYNHRLNYQTFDVTSYIHKENVLTAMVGEGWYAGRLTWLNQRHIYGNRLAAIAQLEIEFEDGDKFRVKSDSTWKSSPSSIVRSEIYDGEDYDMRKMETLKPMWNAPGFDDKHWTDVEVLARPKGTLISSDAPPVRITQEVPAVDVFESPSGKTIVDFGQNLVGVVRLGKFSSPADHTVTLTYAEVLEDGELGIRPLRTAKQVDTITTTGHHSPGGWYPRFTFHGFRYMQVDGWPGMPMKTDFTALVIHSDMRRRGHFSCSHPLVNKLHENIVWGMRGNFLSVPTDCPQRDERLGWTGDIQVFSPTATFLYDTTGFLCNWLEDVAADQLAKEDGIPGLVVPDVLQVKEFKSMPQAIWHDVTVLTPWDLYCRSADIDILQRQYRSMVTWMKAIRRGADQLWDPSLWQLGDWLDPHAPPDRPSDGRTDGVLVADAYLVHVTATMASICTVLGRKEEAEQYRKSSTELKRSFRNKYITLVGNIMCNTQTAISLALCFDLYPAKPDGTKPTLETAAKALSQLVRSSHFRISTGFAGTPLILPALTQINEPQLAYRMLLERHCPSWLYPVTMGATTVWERWDSMLPDGKINPGEMTSFNHYALGSVADWLHESVGGLAPSKRPGEEGWSVVEVRPIPGGNLTWAKATFDGPYGMVKCDWQIKDGKFILKLMIPPNSKARVYLPEATNKDDEGRIIGSGNHTFECPYVAPGEWPPKGSYSPFHLGPEEVFQG